MISINLNIVSDSVEETQKALAALAGGTATVAINVESPIAPVQEEIKAPEPEKPKTTRQRAEKAPSAVETPAPVQTDPLASAPVASSDPLSSTPAPQADPLNAPAPAQSDPLQTAPAAKTEVALQDVRDKIGTLGDKRQQVKDLIATYKKADGTACDRPGDLQEKDYASVLSDLDYI